MFFMEGITNGHKGDFSDELINESYEKNVQDIYIIPNGYGFKIYYRYSKKRTFQQEVFFRY